MAAIYGGGRKLDWGSASSAEFCMATGGEVCRRWPIRRASLCGAMNEAVPARKFSCAPARELQSPQVLASLPTPRPVGPCRVEGCGTPPALMDVQQFRGAVLPMPGVASCPACELTIGTVLGHVVGTAHGTATQLPSGITSVIVRTYFGSSTQDFSLTPTPTQNVSFSKAWFMNRPTSAEIRWTYDDGVLHVAVTPLIVD